MKINPKSQGPRFPNSSRRRGEHNWKVPLKSLCAFLLFISLLKLTPAQNEPTDEAALTVLIKSYYAAVAQKDLGALVRLWSERSPDLAASIEEAQKTFAVDDISFSEIVVSRVRVLGNKAILQVTSNETIISSQTRISRTERSIRSFALIKEGIWKVWREAPAALDLSPFLERGSEW